MVQRIAITPEYLDRYGAQPAAAMSPAQARDAAFALGPLAPLWLDTEVLHKAADLDRGFRNYWLHPALPAELGGCWAIGVRREGWPWPALRHAALIPLLWEEADNHDPCLPPSLIQLAAQVLHDLHGVAKLQSRSWRLRLWFPADSPATCDLSNFDIDADSAWVALAAGLLLRADHIAPRTTVWASGAWDAKVGGVTRIDKVDHKLELARTWSAPVETVFLPSGNHDEIRAWTAAHAPPNDFVQTLDGREADPERALRPYLARLGAAPTLDGDLSDASYAVCKAYYELQEPRRATDFYFTGILPRVLRDRRAQVEQLWPDWRPSHFVTIISGSPELAVLGPLVVAARRCLLLHTPDMAPTARNVFERLDNAGLQADPPREFQLHDLTHRMAEQLSGLIQAFLADAADPAAIVFDATPGKKPMTIALDHLAPPGCWIMYMEHEFKSDKKPGPGNEVVVRYRAGRPLAPRIVLPAKETP